MGSFSSRSYSPVSMYRSHPYSNPYSTKNEVEAHTSPYTGYSETQYPSGEPYYSPPTGSYSVNPQGSFGASPSVQHSQSGSAFNVVQSNPAFVGNAPYQNTGKINKIKFFLTALSMLAWFGMQLCQKYTFSQSGIINRRLPREIDVI